MLINGSAQVYFSGIIEHEFVTTSDNGTIGFCCTYGNFPQGPLLYVRNCNPSFTILVMSKINFKIKLRKLLVSFSQWIAPNEPLPPPKLAICMNYWPMTFIGNKKYGTSASTIFCALWRLCEYDRFCVHCGDFSQKKSFYGKMLNTIISSMRRALWR